MGMAKVLSLAGLISENKGGKEIKSQQSHASPTLHDLLCQLCITE